MTRRTLTLEVLKDEDPHHEVAKLSFERLLGAFRGMEGRVREAIWMYQWEAAARGDNNKQRDLSPLYTGDHVLTWKEAKLWRQPQ